MGIKEEIVEKYLQSIMRFAINCYAKNDDKDNYSRRRF